MSHITHNRNKVQHPWLSIIMCVLTVCSGVPRRRREGRRPAAPRRARSRSWRPARLATPSSTGAATSCDLNSLSEILWLNATPQGRGEGGVRVGTGQRDRTATPNTLTEERMKRRNSPWHNHVGITYIFITLSCTIFILDQKEGGKKKMCAGRGAGH